MWFLKGKGCRAAPQTLYRKVSQSAEEQGLGRGNGLKWGGAAFQGRVETHFQGADRGGREGAVVMGI